jgi:hypothetical protein
MLLENKNAVIGCRQFHRRDSARFVRFVTREMRERPETSATSGAVRFQEQRRQEVGELTPAAQSPCPTSRAG